MTGIRRPGGIPGWVRRRGAGVLLLLGALLVPPSLPAAPEGDAPGRVRVQIGKPAPGSPGRPGDQLLSHTIRVEKPNLKANGQVTLWSLSPLSGELVLEQLDGDPKELHGVLGVLGSWPGQLAQLLDTQRLTLRNLRLVVGGEEKSTLTLARLETPEGYLERVAGERTAADRWRLTARGGEFQRLPVRLRGVGPLTDLVVRELVVAREGERHTLSAPTLGALGAVVEGFTARVTQGVRERQPGWEWEWRGRAVRGDAARMQSVLYRWPGVSGKVKDFLAEEGVQKLDLGGSVRLARPAFQGFLPDGAQVGPWAGAADLTVENGQVAYVAPDPERGGRPRPATFRLARLEGDLSARDGVVRLGGLEPPPGEWPPVLQRLVTRLGVELQAARGRGMGLAAVR